MKNELSKIFRNANTLFLKEQTKLILNGVSERSLCSELKDYLKSQIKDTPFKDYCVNVEYNRNDGKVKTMINNKMEIVTINCDLIIHSQGHNIKKDNLLALEMKKSTRPSSEKIDDKNRLIALTKTSYNDIWSNDGIALPEHVCGYEIGIYYEINIKKRAVLIEQYYRGQKESDYTLNF